MPSTSSVPPAPEAIREQLARILGSPLFRHSRHYPALLKHVVERTLEGRAAHLKERALGVEVFGREPDYDSNLDPVVRTSACEVRKRIAHYYREDAHASELRIELPAGTYVPEFRPAETGAAAEPATSGLAEAPPVPLPQKFWTPLRVAGVLAAALLIGVATVKLPQPANPLERFWGPVWRGADSVMLCVPAAPAAAPGESGGDPSYLDVMRHDRVGFTDALTMARIAGLLEENHRTPDIRRGDEFTLEDFRRGPAILIGAYSNAWTMRLEDRLRFTFERNPDGRGGYIRDRQSPAKAVWRHNPYQPYSKLTQDYAIVSRFIDRRTEEVVVVVGGMGRDGTAAAGEFVTEPRYLRMLASRAPAGWERMNLQVVLSTEIVNGDVGPPRIVATYFW